MLTATDTNRIANVYTFAGNTQDPNVYDITKDGEPFASGVTVYKLSGPTATQTIGTFVKADPYSQAVNRDEADNKITSPADTILQEVQAVTTLQGPVNPETEPTEPVTEPAEPETEPATEPAEPETEPATEPAEPETEPTTEPAEPETEPATEPAESETEPADPTAELAEPEVAPTEVVAEPPKPEETSPAAEPEEDSQEPDNT